MDFTALLFFAFGITYIGGVVYLANQVEAARLQQSVPTKSGRSEQEATFPGTEIPRSLTLRWMLYGMIGLMFAAGFVVLQTALFVEMAGSLDGELQNPLRDVQIDMPTAVIVFGLAMFLSYGAFRLVAFEDMRRRVQRWIGARGYYDPDSPVHTTAVVLMLAIVVWTFATFVLQGGISGMAQDLAQRGYDPSDLIFEGALRVMIALLGVGLAIRRDWAQTTARLGLRVPTRQDVIRGTGMGLLLIVFMIVFGLIWEGLASPEVIEEQTAASDQLNQLFSTLPLAFLLAITAAVGEEIWIRGALQPVFGILVSSLFFVLLHTQVLLTPGILLIFIVSLGFAWLRQTTSTTAAIIAHFIFNFIPLALLSPTL